MGYADSGMRDVLERIGAGRCRRFPPGGIDPRNGIDIQNKAEYSDDGRSITMPIS